MADASDYKEYLRNNKDNCSWSMEADLGKIIEITFKTVDIKDENSKCENYWFQAYDGPNPNSTKLGRRVCNDLIRSKKDYRKINKDYISFKSSGNTLFLSFNENDVRRNCRNCNGGAGFILSYKIKGRTK